MVFVVDKHKKPLMPCSEKRARQLLTRRQAVVHKHAPFTIRLKSRTVLASTLHSVRVQLDPGDKTTGFAALSSHKVLVLGELKHKMGIKDALAARRSLRRGRRNRKTRYRQPRFLNRAGDKRGWLAPSLMARIQQTTNVVQKLRRLLPVTEVSMVEGGTGTRTKYNRMRCGLGKKYSYDAGCVGVSAPDHSELRAPSVFVWSATGRGNRQICQPDKFGFPRHHRSREKFSFGFMTGDLVRARQAKSGRVVVGRLGAARADGSFYITLPDKKRFAFTYKNCQLLQRADGWQYQHKLIS